MDPKLEQIAEGISKLIVMDDRVSDVDRLEFIEAITQGFCRYCGGINLAKDSTCYCRNDD